MEKLDSDTVALLSRRAYDVAASTKGVKVYLNGKRIPIKVTQTRNCFYNSPFNLTLLSHVFPRGSKIM
jgi:hypothetical protein